MRAHYKIICNSFIPLKDHYFSTKSLSTLMHFSILKNYVTLEIELLPLQPFVNKHFHFLIIVELITSPVFLQKPKIIPLVPHSHLPMMWLVYIETWCSLGINSTYIHSKPWTSEIRRQGHNVHTKFYESQSAGSKVQKWSHNPSFHMDGK